MAISATPSVCTFTTAMRKELTIFIALYHCKELKQKTENRLFAQSPILQICRYQMPGSYTEAMRDYMVIKDTWICEIFVTKLQRVFSSTRYVTCRMQRASVGRPKS